MDTSAFARKVLSDLPTPIVGGRANNLQQLRLDRNYNDKYDAKLDGQPVLAITGMQFHDLIGTHTQQDVALDKIMKDAATSLRDCGPDGKQQAGRLQQTIAAKQ